jgi:hypothetical protein
MTAEFTFAGFREMITALLARGYEIKRFAEAEVARQHLILRHDIDQCLNAASRLAEIEADEGWRASYFVLMRSEMYNPFSSAGLRALEKISACGHEIGLHLDAALYGDDLTMLADAAERECAVLETITGRNVSMISLHRPTPNLMPCDQNLAGRRNTYESRYFNEIGYCSDSRGGWHHGPPWEHAAVAEGRALQLLTHAIWWDSNSSESPHDRLQRLVGERNQVVHSELVANNAVYRRGDQ